MAVKLRKPILVAGLGISAVLWVGESFQSRLADFGEWSLMGTIALATGLWLWQRQTRKTPNLLSYSPLTRETVEQAISQAKIVIDSLTIEATHRDISHLKQKIAQLPLSFDREDVRISITGGKKVGKSSLKQLLKTQNIAENICFLETEALLTATDTDAKKLTDISLSTDLVLFLTTGDLTESEWRILQQLKNAHQQIILLFNKQDQYIPEERSLILQQLRQRVQEIVPANDIIAIATVPNSIKVRQHQEDGTIQESSEAQTANISLLKNRLTQILSQEREQLVWGQIWREAVNLKQQTKQILNEVRRERAIPIIEQYQWIAAAAALANPVSALDLLATVAINAQMLVDLSAIYQQKFTLSQAQAAAKPIGQLMVKLGLVELSTQTIGGLLKSNALTYLAGGAVQGISAAYLTRLAGLSLIEYFQEQEVSTTAEKGFNLERLGTKLKQVFEQNQRIGFWQAFIKQGMAKLASNSPETKLYKDSPA